MYTDPSGYLSSADITAGTINQANLINTGMSVYLTVLHKLYAASKVNVEEFQTISGGDWAFSLFESAFDSGFFINNLILCLTMTNIAGACVMIGVVGTVMCMMFMIAAADAALDGNDALEQYYGLLAVLSLAGAFFGFDQAMKEAGITADQLAVAKENASVVTDSNVDINHTTVPPVSGGSSGASSASKGGSNTKPNQVHHFATNKSSKYTSQFESITKKYGLDLDDSWNKALMPHQGRHPYAIMIMCWIICKDLIELQREILISF